MPLNSLSLWTLAVLSMFVALLFLGTVKEATRMTLNPAFPK